MSNTIPIIANRYSGYTKATRFEASISYVPIEDIVRIKWSMGDGSFYYNRPTIEHYYSVPGEYEITVHAYTANDYYTSKITVSVTNFLKESIYFDVIPPPTFAGHYNRYPFRVHITSLDERPHTIDLYSQFSRSYQYQEPQNKWSFLKPQWRFLDLSGNQVWTVQTTDTLIKIDEDGRLTNDGLTIGVSGYAEFYFIDDIYNSDLAVDGEIYTTIWATLQTSAIRVPADSKNADLTLPGFSNSSATAFAPHVFLRRQPEQFDITENGIRPHANPRWTSAEQPVIIKTGFSENYYDDWIDGNGVLEYDKEANFARYVPLEAPNVPINAGVIGMDTTFSPTPEIKWIDDTTYKVAGYYKGSFTTTTPFSLNTKITASSNILTPPTSSHYFNPLIWLSNPDAGTFSIAQYYKNDRLKFEEIDTPNLEVAQVRTVEMPVISEVDFDMDQMALSGFHGIYSIAALPAPNFHAWIADSEMNRIYRMTSKGDILHMINLHDVLSANKLNYLIEKQISPAHISVDGNKNLWVTLYDTVSVLKFDNYGNFLFATHPLDVISYDVPWEHGRWFNETTRYTTEDHINIFNYRLGAFNGDVNIIEPTGVDPDKNNDAWVTYSNATNGYIVKYSSCGDPMSVIFAPACSTPQEVLVDKDNNVWICYNGIVWNAPGVIEKRTSEGVLLSSFDGIRNPNYISLDLNQNLWFSWGYNKIGVINNITGYTQSYTITGVDLVCESDSDGYYHPRTDDYSFSSDYPKGNLPFDWRESKTPWFDENQNADETAIEGVACDMRGYLYILNSIENQVYVFNTKTRTLIDRFYINPQGFLFTIDDQLETTNMEYYLWAKSLQAAGDWTGWKWTNKYGLDYLPYYTNETSYITITGESSPINFYDRSIYTAFKINEDFDLAEKMYDVASMPILKNSESLFNNFLGTIFGKKPFYQDDLAVVAYEKIANFVLNNSDPDTCEIPQLYNLSKMIDSDGENYQLDYPPTIRRIMNLGSVNLSKLLGVNCNCGLSFERPNDCAKIQICSYCKKEKKSNRGNLISTLNYEITAGTSVVLKNKSINDYRLVPTGYVNSLTAYTINDLATSIGFNTDWQDFYEFYEYIPAWNGGIIENLIDWNSEQTTINRTISTSNEWFRDEGLLDIFLNYEIYKGLGLLDE